MSYLNKLKYGGDVSDIILEQYAELNNALGFYFNLINNPNKLSLENYGCVELIGKINVSNENAITGILKKIVDFIKYTCKVIYQYWVKFKNFIKQLFVKTDDKNKQLIDYVKSLPSTDIAQSQLAFNANKTKYNNFDKWVNLLDNDGKLINITDTVKQLNEFVNKLGNLENGGNLKKLIEDIRYFEKKQFSFGYKAYVLNPDNLDNPFTAVTYGAIVRPSFTKDELIEHLTIDKTVTHGLIELQERSSKSLSVFSTEVAKIKDESHLEYGRYLQTLVKIYSGITGMVTDVVNIVRFQELLVTDIFKDIYTGELK